MRRHFLSALASGLLLATPALAIDFASPHPDIHARNEFDIGVDLVQHQKFDEATEHLQVALQQYPHDLDILAYLGFAHRMIARHRTGTSHESELRLSNDYYMRALDLDPRRKDFLEYMGELYLEMDDPASADAKLAALTRVCPNGCVQRDTLATAIASYKPAPSPVATPLPPVETSSSQDATGAPAPLTPDETE
jgi:tetratricopeptide (TPR) repeat protein